MNISGVQIQLRDFQEPDLETMRHWLQPGHRWQELDGPYFGPIPEADIENGIARAKDRIESPFEGDLPPSLVICRSDDPLMLGTVGWRWHSKETHWPEIGILIFDSSKWGQGYGYEAMGLWTDALFSNLSNIVRVDLRTWSGHAGMIALAHKLGFKEEARFRQARIVRGEYFDGLGFGVLRSEWETCFPSGFGWHLQKSPGI